MARIVDISEATFNRIMKAITKVESQSSIKGKSKTELIKRPGSQFYYFEILSSVDENEYICDLYDNPVDRTLLIEDVTVYAKKHTLGVLPVSTAGKGEWAILANNGNYYFTSYSTFYGE